MSDRFFRQIDAARARAARDEAAGLTTTPTDLPRPRLPRVLARALFAWIALVILLLLIGEQALAERLGGLTPLVALPGVLIRVGSYLGVVPDRLLGGRTTGEGVLLSLLFWSAMALVAWVDAALGGLASLLIAVLLLRRVNAIALHGMYLAERARIRGGRPPSEPLSGSPAPLDGPPTTDEISTSPAKPQKEL